MVLLLLLINSTKYYTVEIILIVQSYNATKVGLWLILALIVFSRSIKLAFVLEQISNGYP